MQFNSFYTRLFDKLKTLDPDEFYEYLTELGWSCKDTGITKLVFIKRGVPFVIKLIDMHEAIHMSLEEEFGMLGERSVGYLYAHKYDNEDYREPRYAFCVQPRLKILGDELPEDKWKDKLIDIGYFLEEGEGNSCDCHEYNLGMNEYGRILRFD